MLGRAAIGANVRADGAALSGGQKRVVLVQPARLEPV